jgi:hypothetical protein
MMQKLKSILANDPALRSLTQSAKAQQQIQQAWAKAVPAELADFCQAGALQNKRLTILVANNAVAAKIKFLMPHIVGALQAQQLPVSTLRTQLLSTNKPRPKPQRSLPNAAATSLASFAQGQNTPLAQQIQQFLAKAKK